MRHISRIFSAPNQTIKPSVVFLSQCLTVCLVVWTAWLVNYHQAKLTLRSESTKEVFGCYIVACFVVIYTLWHVIFYKEPCQLLLFKMMNFPAVQYNS